MHVSIVREFISSQVSVRAPKCWRGTAHVWSVVLSFSNRSVPDSRTPRSPTKVSYPSGSLEMKSWALACFAAAMTSAMDADCTPNEMFSRMLVQNSTGSWLTSWQGRRKTKPITKSDVFLNSATRRTQNKGFDVTTAPRRGVSVRAGLPPHSLVASRARGSYSNIGSQPSEVQCANVDAVDADLTRQRVIEALDHGDTGGLPGPAHAH